MCLSIVYVTCTVSVWPVCRVGVQIPEISVRDFTSVYGPEVSIRTSMQGEDTGILTTSNTSGNTNQKWFDEIKCVIGREVNAPFLIHTGASKLHIGAVISQKCKTIAFYSRNMSSSQQNYTTTEKEILYIVAFFKYFRNIILGHQITVNTDHKNLTCNFFNT